MIFKIQKPLYGGTQYLLYNKDKTVMTDNLEIGDMPELDKLFEETDKIYIKGYIDRKHQIILSKPVNEQEW